MSSLLHSERSSPISFSQNSTAWRGSQVILFWTVAVIWITVFSSFNLLGRGHLAAGEIDTFALVKVLLRLVSITVLSWVAFSELRKQAIQRFVVLYWPWALFVGWAILSTAWSPSKSVTLGQAAGQLQLLVLSMAVGLCYQTGYKTVLIHTVLALLVYSLLFGIGELFSGVGSLSRSSEKQFVHPTALAAAASLGLILATSLLTSEKLTSLKFVSVLAIPIFAIALVAAHSRTALLTTPVVCTLMVILRGKTHVLAVGSIAVALLGTCYIVCDPGLTAVETVFGSSVEFLERGQSTSQITELSGRSEMWSKMWSSYLDSPLIGHGYFVCSKTGTLYVWHLELNHTAHNVLLQAMVSTGLVGLILFVTWNLSVLTMFLKDLRHPTQASLHSPDSLFFILALGTSAWFLVWCMMNESMLGPVRPESAVYAIVMGLVVGRFHFRQQSRNDLSQQSVNLEDEV